jgi:hypothetical protein
MAAPATKSSPGPSPQAVRARHALLLAVGITAVLYAVPYGRYAAWPLLLFATFAHELGHGVAAWVVGGSFHKLQMWADGSGMATIGGYDGALDSAFVSAGGLVGPSVMALVLFTVARKVNHARVGLYALGVVMVILTVLVVRNLFGFFFVAAVGAVFLVVARKTSAAVAQFVLVFVAVQLSLAVFSNADYLFTDVARTAGGTIPSDTGQMARALGGPYWFWGALVGLISVAVLVQGARIYLKALRLR